MPKIHMKFALLLPYYGKIPDFFSFFLKSLEGKCFDVICFTDLEIGRHPANFIKKNLSLKDLEKLAERKLGVKVVLDYPYKLCDLKPMYGKIFEDYIQDYDYWAFGDCDLVYGNLINDALPKLIDQDYDIISFCKMWLSGSFCWLRNCEKVNSLFRRARNYKEILASSHHETFDEIGGNWYGKIRAGEMTVEDCGRLKDNFTAVVWRSSDIQVFHEDITSEEVLKDDLVKMQNGHLFRNDVEIPIFHFVMCKHVKLFLQGFRKLKYDEVSDYTIARSGFYCSPMEWHCRGGICAYRHCLVAVTDLASIIRRGRRAGFAGILRAIKRRFVSIFFP